MSDLMRLALGLLATSLGAQTIMPVGIVRGDVVSTQAGELTVRNTQNTVYGCFYDARTYFERNDQSVAVGSLAAGDPVEVVADRKPGSANCYARIVQVVRTGRPRRAAPIERFTPRGDMTLGGVVLGRAPRVLTLKTRAGQVSLRLRPDTRYLGEGSSLVNRHVFVRYGRNLDGDLEAYQIVWGEMLTP
jgi:hypothetical protein